MSPDPGPAADDSAPGSRTTSPPSAAQVAPAPTRRNTSSRLSRSSTVVSRKEKARDNQREFESDTQYADDAAKDPNTNSVAGPGASAPRATPPLPSQSP